MYFINTINQFINKPSLSTCPTFSSSSETANCFFFFGFNFQYMTKAAFLTALSKSVSDDNFFTSCSFSEVMPQEKRDTLDTIIPHPCRNDRFAHNFFSLFSLKLLKFHSCLDHLSKLLKCPSVYQNLITLLKFKLYFKDCARHALSLCLASAFEVQQFRQNVVRICMWHVKGSKNLMKGFF